MTDVTTRPATGETDGTTIVPVKRFTPGPAEAKWRERWERDGLYRTSDDAPEPKWYSLTMYPYPSGTLHIGHWYAFTVPDVFARHLRMRGFNVLFPMGFDAFGLPAENAAIREGIHPAIRTVRNIEQMRAQFRLMGVMIDWSRELASCTPEYYRWNQWFFLRMLERGLAYRANGAVWWCPNDQTVLANEQVLEGNICERCGAEVYKRDLEQWYLRITDYAEELLHDAEDLDWPERVKTMQRNWIGRSEGARLVFKLETGGGLEVFTTRPDTVWGATFMVLAPEHPLVGTLTTSDQRAAVEEYQEQARRQTEIERMSTDESRPRTGVFTGAYAVNPVNGARIPVWIADYVLMGYGTGAIMAVPYGDQRDFEFARHFGLPIVPVVQPEDRAPFDPATMTEAYHGPGRMVSSGPLDGTRVPDELPTVLDWLEANGVGTREVNYRLRDWLISRQRYWGTPIPVVYCDACGIVPVPDDQLPVVLPSDADFQPTGQSPLVSHDHFLNVACPTCGGPARRETDTLDTFVDSSWYWYRFTSPGYDDGPFDPAKAAKWCPVDLYCGGIEHAILHLLYARFWTKVSRDMGLIDHGEPFLRLRNQGMILSTEGVKMSKSRGTQVDPEQLVQQYGVDALRLHLMYLGPWDQGGPWNDHGVTGMEGFIQRVYRLVSAVIAAPPSGVAAPDDGDREVRRQTHQAIQSVTEDIGDFRFNTAIAALIEFTNWLTKRKDGPIASTVAWREAVETLVVLMAPMTPYAAEEMWDRLGKPYSVHTQRWPTFDPEVVKAEEVELIVQVNGRVRDRLIVPADVTEATARDLALASERVREQLGGKEPAKVVFVPGKLVNVVVR